MAPTCQYRSGVKVGNYTEQLASEVCQAPAAPRFEGASESRAAFGAEGKTGAALAAASKREDILLTCKYGGSGPASAAAASAEPSCFATTSQLAYQPASDLISGGAAAPRKIQDCLWAGTKFVDSKVPRSVGDRAGAAARRARLAAEQGRSVYTSVLKEDLEAAARSPARGNARQPQARPQAEGGQEAQVGRKATGEFRAHCDKDYLRIGLRR